MSWRIDKAMFETLPPGHRAIAHRLMEGSRYVRGQFGSHQRRVLAYKNGQSGWILKPSLAARLVDLRETFRTMARECLCIFRQAVRDFYLLGNQPTNLQHGQKPDYAIVDCSDARIQPHAWFQARAPGQVFSLQNVGSSLENPLTPNELSTDAKDFITYARHIGVKKFIIFTHGKCGCMANAVCPDHQKPMVGEATLEKQVIRQMALRKQHIHDLIQQKGEAYFLQYLDAPSVDGLERTKLAAEIAHGLHCKKLAEDYVAALDASEGKTDEPSMTVYLVHKELRTLDAHIWNPNTGRFLRLSHNTPIPDVVEAVK
ncbi:MAG: carbonic anhydrase [Bdellovibrionales bacterium]